MDCSDFINTLHSIQSKLHKDVTWYITGNRIHYVNMETIQNMQTCIEDIKNSLDTASNKIQDIYAANRIIKKLKNTTLKNTNYNHLRYILDNLQEDKINNTFVQDDENECDDVDFIRCVYFVLSQLNNGISWDNIDITKYDIIEKHRCNKSSVSEYSKFVFTIKINADLKWISENIKEFEKTYLYIYEPYNYRTPLPRNGHLYDLEKIPIRCTSIQKAPFMEDYIIEKTQRPRDC